MVLRVALSQIARLEVEVERTPDFAICRSHAEILAARKAGQIALLITMEGVEPLGGDPDMLRIFHKLGVRSLGLTHARRNLAGEGGVFAPSGSSSQGLTAHGKELVRLCEQLGIMVDLAHLNPAGFDDVLAMTAGPVIISHTNPRAFFDIERNSSDEQIVRVAERGGIVGLGAVLLSNERSKATADGFVDQIEYMVELAGIDHVGLGFDFCKLLIDQCPAMAGHRRLLPVGPAQPQPLRNVTRIVIERGFADEDIGKILYGNWMQLFEEVL